MDAGMLLAGVALLASVYCFGGLHGLLLAWSQEARMRRWAAWVDRNYDRITSEVERPAERKSAG